MAEQSVRPNSGKLTLSYAGHRQRSADNMITGDKSQFAFEVGSIDPPESSLRIVDIWASDHHLTCWDNTVYIPQLAHFVECDVKRLNDSNTFPPLPNNISPVAAHRQYVDSDHEKWTGHDFMDWGPTSDYVRSLVFREDDKFHITFEICLDEHPEKGQIFMITIPPNTFIDLLSKMAELTREGYTQNKPVQTTDASASVSDG